MLKENSHFPTLNNDRSTVGSTFMGYVGLGPDLGSLSRSFRIHYEIKRTIYGLTGDYGSEGISHTIVNSNKLFEEWNLRVPLQRSHSIAMKNQEQQQHERETWSEILIRSMDITLEPEKWLITMGKGKLDVSDPGSGTDTSTDLCFHLPQNLLQNINQSFRPSSVAPLVTRWHQRNAHKVLSEGASEGTLGVATEGDKLQNRKKGRDGVTDLGGDGVDTKDDHVHLEGFISTFPFLVRHSFRHQQLHPDSVTTVPVSSAAAGENEEKAKEETEGVDMGVYHPTSDPEVPLSQCVTPVLWDTQGKRPWKRVHVSQHHEDGSDDEQ